MSYYLRSASCIMLGLLAGISVAQAGDEPQTRSRTPASCPDYTVYSQKRHGPYSTGPLAVPFMRPSPECRTFHSSAVEASFARSDESRHWLTTPTPESH
ncbi:Uncharacterized protein TCAP_03781 [Tolypocladium capitatum]|uniref:Uncharacterized protein n=1 Tax=Tolypocladium capitatum TaxID=45235 RepID=A0A2K3QFG2_9HYPO|nr:Uncharacterized protein TCAP_03781 [Tolypocladium capitatum]